MWHSKLGGFLGQLVMFLRKYERWMTVGEALFTGVNHGHFPKSEDEARDAWHRGDCLIMKDDKHLFSRVVEEVKHAYERADAYVDEDLWKQLQEKGRDLEIASPATAMTILVKSHLKQAEPRKLFSGEPNSISSCKKTKTSLSPDMPTPNQPCKETSRQCVIK
jgi:hypothetical protein